MPKTDRRYSTDAAGIGTAHGEAGLDRPRRPFVIPTLHPAALFRDPKGQLLLLADLEKAKRLISEEPRTPLSFWTYPNVRQVCRFLAPPYEGQVFAVDTETMLDGTLVCCGIYEGTIRGGLCVPIYQCGGTRYWSETDEVLALGALRDFLRSPAAEKIFHNSPFDLDVLEKAGFEVNGVLGDTLLVHYLLFPDFRHRLAAVASYYTDLAPYKERPWRDESGEGKTGE